MNEEDIRIPIYLITGFLEAGKTSFLDFTMKQPYFMTTEKTLLISCEEGEVEYKEKDLHLLHTDYEVIRDPEDLTFENLRKMHRKYRPARVLMEYNAMWGMKRLLDMRLPLGWGVVQQIVVADASTFQLYMNNMKSIFVEMAQNADMVLFNRCTKELPLANFRRSIKVVNPACDVQFMGLDREPVDIFEDAPPFDLNSDVVEIDDVDYGIFYVDARDNPDRYKGKKVRFKGVVLTSRESGADFFVPARSAMTCCADDIQYIGYLCHYKNAAKLTAGSWVDVTARVDWKFVPQAHEEQPVLQAIAVAPCDPPAEELVYFN